jgi:hypothetical protein
MTIEVVEITTAELRKMILSAFVFGFSLRNLMMWVGLLWRIVRARPNKRELVNG